MTPPPGAGFIHLFSVEFPSLSAELPMKLSILAGVSLLAAGLAGAQAPAKPGAPKAIDRANMDTTCDACTDFYTFANGSWLKKNSIPAAYPEWGSFYQLNDQNEAIVRDIVEKADKAVKAGTAKPGTNTYKVGAYFDACMDTTTIETLGTKP